MKNIVTRSCISSDPIKVFLHFCHILNIVIISKKNINFVKHEEIQL